MNIESLASFLLLKSSKSNIFVELIADSFPGDLLTWLSVDTRFFSFIPEIRILPINLQNQSLSHSKIKVNTIVVITIPYQVGLVHLNLKLLNLILITSFFFFCFFVDIVYAFKICVIHKSRFPLIMYSQISVFERTDLTPILKPTIHRHFRIIS